MKIGTCVNFTSIEEMEAKFATLRTHGFTTCQLLSWDPKLWTNENAKILNELFAQ